MNKVLSQSIIFGLLALSLGACGFFGGEEENPEEAPPQANGGTAAPPEAIAQDFPNPTEAGDPVAVPAAPPSVLIPATDPQQRNVPAGRSDPFDMLTVQPKITIIPPEVPAPAPGAKPGNPGAPAATAPGTSGTTATQPVNGVLPMPPQSGITYTTPATATTPAANGSFDGSNLTLPQLPEPTLARNVEVTGLIEINNTKHLIVRSPEDGGNRYVKVGDFLANGQVLIKRVELRRGLSPVVVLEQYGIEVPKEIRDEVAYAEVNPPL